VGKHHYDDLWPADLREELHLQVQAA